ncbi:MAG: metal-dependent hydrolase [Bdellovibrionales bacterium]|nr:metal-dependent hydrolase [Bdellovibrionales bacterium]
MIFESITFAGHSAVFFNASNKVVAIDPWLEGNPRCPNTLMNPSKLDLIVLTHGHSDHANDVVRLSKSTGCKIAATFELCSLLVQAGIPESRIIYMNKGGTVDVDGVLVTLTNAYHSSSFETERGAVYAGEPCGVILRDEKRAIYHAGDTSLFSDMSLIKEFYAPQVALLPIGDRFTMGPKEAAKAAKLVGCTTAIPIHYDTFDLLTGTAKEFQTACGQFQISTTILAPGESLELN